MQKPCEENLEFHGLENEMSIGQAYTTDEAIPILDLRYPGAQVENEPVPFDHNINPRRMSGSSFTMSTSGGLSEMTSYEDFSAAMSDAPSFSSDYPPPSNRNSLMSSTQLSPVASPRMTPQSRSELVRTQSRGRASPSPRPGMRSAPYSVESARNKRWSTGSYGTTPNRRHSPFVYHPHDAYGQRMSSRHSSPTIAHSQVPLNMGNLQTMQQQAYFMPPNPAFPRHSMLLPSQLPSNGYHHPDPHALEHPPPLMSHGLFRMLQSNADPHSLHGHHTDLSDPPDLYASLHEEQIPPPPEDMNPSDPDLVPHEQELRFEGDLYTPRWVRGHGNKREGWCGICKPGRWLVLKNSAFWYDKSFTHGISAATGNPFQEPQETRRMDGNPDVWEGLCGSCNDWIALVSSKKKGTTWFRHAYKVRQPEALLILPNSIGRKLTAIVSITVPYASQDQGCPQAEAGEQPYKACRKSNGQAQDRGSTAVAGTADAANDTCIDFNVGHQHANARAAAHATLAYANPSAAASPALDAGPDPPASPPPHAGANVVAYAPTTASHDAASNSRQVASSAPNPRPAASAPADERSVRAHAAAEAAD